jgi:hypothetical protein
LTAATSKDIAKALMSGFITNVVGKLLTPGSGSTATICDVHMNGTTIFDAATKMTFAATTGVASYSALASEPISVTYGSMFSLDVDSISTNPANVVVQITVSRTPLALASNNEDQAEVL